MDAQTNSTQIDSQIPPAARQFLEETTMKSIFGIPDEALDAIMALAYQLYQVGRYSDVEVLSRGLIAADHRYWWSYSLYAATLRRLGRLREALAELEKGLTYEPNEPKLLFMRSEIGEALARETRPSKASPSPTVAPSTSTTHPRVAA
jgi:tetratricopeptide (TPR) repeat protein